MMVGACGSIRDGVVLGEPSRWGMSCTVTTTAGHGSGVESGPIPPLYVVDDESIAADDEFAVMNFTLAADLQSVASNLSLSKKMSQFQQKCDVSLL
jgi:hypothetical protein